MECQSRGRVQNTLCFLLLHTEFAKALQTRKRPIILYTSIMPSLNYVPMIFLLSLCMGVFPCLKYFHLPSPAPFLSLHLEAERTE